MEAKWAYMFTLDCRVTHWQIGNEKNIYILLKQVCSYIDSF